MCVDQFLDQFIAEKDQILAHAEELSIELDAVVFSDGTLIGADEGGWLSDLFSECVAHKQAWYREILNQLDAGASIEEAYAPIRMFQEEFRACMRDPQRSRHGAAQLWKTQAAADAQKCRRKFSDEELPQLLRKSIRLEPFVIRREPDLRA